MYINIMTSVISDLCESQNQYPEVESQWSRQLPQLTGDFDFLL